MVMQMKSMSDQITQLTKAMANKETHQMAAAAVVVAAVAAAVVVVADYEIKDEKTVALWSNLPNHKAWAATVPRTDSIRPARTTHAPPVSGNNQTTT
jgi:hypothetical protein